MSFLPVIPALLSRCIAMSCGPCGDDGVPGAEEKTGSASDLSLGVKLALTKRLGSSLFHRYWARTHEGTVVAGNPKFVSAAEAVACIPDNAVLAVSGIAANQPATMLVRALVERFKATQAPRNLTLVAVSGVGARGKARGSLEDIAIKGLLRRQFAGHIESFKAMLKAAEEGWLEIQGTFVDPRCGRGTPLVPASAPQYVKPVAGKPDLLTYSLPALDVVWFNAPAADHHGNIYNRGAPVQCEMVEMAMAARRNGGVVIALVGMLVEPGYGDITVPTENVDFVVVHRDVEGTLASPHNNPLRFLTLDSTTSRNHGLARARFLNGLVGATPKRTPADHALSRLGATLLAREIGPGCSVQIGTGMPEELAAVLHSTGVLDELETIVESGVLGGVASPGAFFGTSINPQRIVSSAQAFHRIYDHLDAIIVGALQVDSKGNVNVSKRGEGPKNYVGPGGFIDLTTNAKIVMFCTTFFAGGSTTCEGGRMSVDWTSGHPCFVDNVDEVTFSGAEALKRGQKVFYITHVGAFMLTPSGMELVAVMPGVHAQRDIVEATAMSIVLPPGGAAAVPPVPASVVSGRGFALTLTGPAASSRSRGTSSSAPKYAPTAHGVPRSKL